MFTLQEKIGQMMMVGFEGTTLPSHIKDWLSTGRIGGVYLFARNVQSPQQVKKLIDECHAVAKYPILVGIDQEGGIVARLREGFTESPGAMALGASGDETLAEEIAYMMGQELIAMGVNWNFAPVADITHNINNPSVGTRSIGTDKDHVSRFVQAQIRGFQRAGIAATVKHFPGLGNTPVDTHDALAIISDPIDYLYEQDLIPFRGAIESNVACVMTTHVMFEQLDENYPATLSPIVINQLLRNELGYKGVVCTDCMEMKAITDTYGASESAILTVLAGVDLVMYSHTQASQELAFNAVLKAVEAGRIPEDQINESIERIQKLKVQYTYKNPPPITIIGSTDHQALAQKAARAGIVLHKSDKNFPLITSDDNILSIEFSTQIISDAVEAGSHHGFSMFLKQQNAQIQTQIINPLTITPQVSSSILEQVSAYKTIILGTRNAHMLSAQAELAQKIIGMGNRVVLVCLRNPYDAGILEQANTIICTNGDSTPSLQAAAHAIFGHFVPTGKLSITIG